MRIYNNTKSPALSAGHNTHGGGVCESNTPGPALPTPTGFEVRAQHQLKLASMLTVVD